jgi:hypothetical protein
MKMIWSYSQLPNLKTMVRCNVRKDFSNLTPDIFSLNPFLVPRRPNQMVLRVVNRMCTPELPSGAYIIFFLPLANAPFIPVHRTGVTIREPVGLAHGEGLQIAHLLAQLLYKATLLKRDFPAGY